jgi:hypothetical protein
VEAIRKWETFLSIVNIKGGALVGGKVKVFFKPLSKAIATKTKYFSYFHPLQLRNASHIKRSTTHMKQNTCVIPPIFTIPQELIVAIALLKESAAITPFKGQSSELLIARTCKHLYELYKQYHEGRTALVLCHPRDERSIYSDHLESLYRHRNPDLWLRTKFISISDYEGDNYPVKILCLNQMFDLPDRLNYKSFDALIMIFYHHVLRKFTADIFFFEKFTNLTSITLKNGYHSCCDEKLTLPNPLLKSISLHGSKMNNIESNRSNPEYLSLLQVSISSSTQLQSL